MGRCWLLIVCCFLFGNLSAQRGFPDSLRQKISGLPLDSNYVNVLNQAATEYLKTDPGISRSVCVHVLDLATKLNFTRGYARSLTVMGNSYWYEGVYEFAQNYYLLAARQYQSINDSTGLGETFNNIGEVYKRLNDFDKSLEYLSKALQIIGSDSSKYALILYNIGELHIKANRLPVARQFIDRSYKTAIRIQDKRLIAYNYWALAAISLKKNEYETALAYYFDSEKIWKEASEIRSLIQTYQDIASVYLLKKDFSQSKKYLDRAISLAQQIKVPDLQVKNYLRHSHLDSIKGDYKSALLYLSKHNLLKDSVYNILKAEQIARLQTIYETENREFENQQLRTDRELKDAQISYQNKILIAISSGLLLAGVLLIVLHRQRQKILFQKNAIEVQAQALLQLNTELQNLNKSLEQRISERTKQLTLQNKRITEYTFINAHKLRGPVASVLGLINLLQQTDLQERDVVLTHLKTCGEQLDKIIHEISRELESALVNDSENNKA